MLRKPGEVAIIHDSISSDSSYKSSQQEEYNEKQEGAHDLRDGFKKGMWMSKKQQSVKMQLSK